MKNIIFYNLGFLVLTMLIAIFEPIIALMFMAIYGPLQVFMSFFIVCYTGHIKSRWHAGIHVILSVIILILIYGELSDGSEFIIPISIISSSALFLYSFVVHYLNYKDFKNV